MHQRFLLAAVAMIGLAPGPLRAQRPAVIEVPFSDPGKAWQQIFGRQSKQDQAALADVEVTVGEEQQYGKRAAGAFAASLKRRGIRVTTQGRDVEYVSRLVQSLHPQMRNSGRYSSLTVFLVESDETDAFAFPGGTLFVFRGMLDFASNEAALVGVIGHELSHIDRGHQLNDLRRMKFAQRSFSGDSEFAPDKFFQSGMLLLRSFMRPFRPEDETEADIDGATWAYRAGYDPRELAALFVRLSERDGGRADGLPSFLRTHPYHADRHAAIVALDQQLRAAEPHDKLYRGAQNLRQRVTRSQREFPE